MVNMVISRRSHPKSRLGCKTCKVRKVKCDEKKPACGNCIKHNANCDFLAVSTPVPSPVLQQFNGLNMADLELLHNFTTSTYTTFSASLSMREYYRVNVVQLGFKHDYIMRTLLAISGLHIARYRAQSSDYWLSIASAHHQAASQTAMSLMSDVTTENAPMLFLFSNLTMFFALAAPRQESDFLLVGESGFPHWMFLLRGVRIFQPYLTTESKAGDLAPLLQDGGRRWLAQHAASLGAEAPVKQHLDHVAHLIKQTCTEDLTAQEIYLDAIQKLERTFGVYLEMLLEGEERYDVRMAFIWLFEVSDSLLPLLRVPTQEAAVLLAFFAILLKKSPDLWWIHGWPEHLIDKIYGVLDEEHRLWIKWPMEEMGWVAPS